ncbi:MAG: hypothetical protein M0R75_09795 [Dehalococcoidia bacterium]|nr:hypothetical protein [Dehalococcoidia bacterium]
MASFPALLTATVAAAAGYVAARQLMSDDAPRRIEQLPEHAQAPVAKVRGKLLRGRDRAREAVRAGKAERDAAEQELTAEYRRKTHRP